MRTVVLADDLDGSTPAETITFAVNGRKYEMELGKRNVDAMKEVMQPFIDKAREVSGRNSSPLPRGAAYKNTLQRREWLAQVRTWLRKNGHPNLSDFGRVPAALMEQYEEAHR
jgi:hypothetical protein